MGLKDLLRQHRSATGAHDTVIVELDLDNSHEPGCRSTFDPPPSPRDQRFSTPVHDRFATQAEETQTDFGGIGLESTIGQAAPLEPPPPPISAMSTSYTASPTLTSSDNALTANSTSTRPSSAAITSSPSSSTSRRADVHGSGNVDDHELEDGPLFRALLSDNERRSKVLRSSLKTFARAAQDSLDALKEAHESQLALDLAAQSLTTGTSVILGGLWDKSIARRRTMRMRELQTEIDNLLSVLANVREAIERLKSVDKRRKDFEHESKRYYEELGKYLAKVEPDSTKSTTLEQKQASRAASFEQERLDYFYAIEGLVESEEAAVALWLQQWAGILDDPSVKHAESEEVLRKSRQRQRATVARSLGERMLESATNDELFDGETDSDDDAASLSATSAGSAFSGIIRRRSETKKNRRASLPHFGADGQGTTGDRFKGLLSKTGERISSATQQISSAAQQAGHQLSSVAEQLSNAATSSNKPSQDKATLAPPINIDRNSDSPRRKEGLLFATKAGVGHASQGDGGGAWTAHWCVLSEGQFVEFSSFNKLDVKNAPINLALASVRASRNTERRNCFEILDPTKRRIYQATSEAEMNEWISAISSACEGLLNGTSSVRQFDSSKLLGTSRPYLLKDFGGSATHLQPQSSVSSHPSVDSGRIPSSTSVPTSPRSSSSNKMAAGFKDFSNRLPPWIGAPLSRRASAGQSRRESKSSASSSIIATGFRQVNESSAGPSNGRPPLSPGPHSFSTTVISSSPRPPLTTSESFQEVELQGIDQNGAAGAPDTGRKFDLDIVNGVTAMKGKTDSPNESKSRNAARIKGLAAMPGNSTCAECGAPDPRWASWSLGVFLCIGVHRSLGTHVSKVRSIDLDEWNDEQVASMEALGNVKANGNWQALKPTSYVVNDSNVVDFIKAKYVDQKFKSL
ncbi:hypothetical protein OIO90_005077 [Microbotryomycetes sp. JL221]|nr:hypothetical protein OIO90_005077 [Microbotryomycetes sp. JL221]